MSGLTGDYSSMAEAVGDAPPRGRFETGDEIAELMHDVGGDTELADHIMEYAHVEDERNRAAWYREQDSLDHYSTEELQAELDRRS